jgi:hypothetical protein
MFNLIKRMFKPKPLQTKESFIQAYFREYGNLKCPKCGHAEMKRFLDDGFIMRGFYFNDDSCLGCGTVVGPEWASDAFMPTNPLSPVIDTNYSDPGMLDESHKTTTRVRVVGTTDSFNDIHEAVAMCENDYFTSNSMSEYTIKIEGEVILDRTLHINAPISFVGDGSDFKQGVDFVGENLISIHADSVTLENCEPFPDGNWTKCDLNNFPEKG